ncbi:hypothetical protein ACFP81_06470 [Deinococcus lacus]|uniref:Lipoprotein n=1 Tax=Deinococcus lacus TaxID=392561 RepID=A0ABW1YBK1_9DEIO
MKKLLMLPLLALALTACSGGNSAPDKPVETKTPSYYNPVGIWDLRIASQSAHGGPWSAQEGAIEITAENVRDNNQWWSYRSFDPYNNWKPVDSETSIAYGNTKSGEIVLSVDSVGSLSCKGAFDTIKNYYVGECKNSGSPLNYRVAMKRR